MDQPWNSWNNLAEAYRRAFWLDDRSQKELFYYMNSGRHLDGMTNLYCDQYNYRLNPFSNWRAPYGNNGRRYSNQRYAEFCNFKSNNRRYNDYHGNRSNNRSPSPYGRSAEDKNWRRDRNRQSLENVMTSPTYVNSESKGRRICSNRSPTNSYENPGTQGSFINHSNIKQKKHRSPHCTGNSQREMMVYSTDFHDSRECADSLSWSKLTWDSSKQEESNNNYSSTECLGKNNMSATQSWDSGIHSVLDGELSYQASDFINGGRTSWSRSSREEQQHIVEMLREIDIRHQNQIATNQSHPPPLKKTHSPKNRVECSSATSCEAIMADYCVGEEGGTNPHSSEESSSSDDGIEVILPSIDTSSNNFEQQRAEESVAQQTVHPSNELKVSPEEFHFHQDQSPHSLNCEGWKESQSMNDHLQRPTVDQELVYMSSVPTDKITIDEQLIMLLIKEPSYLVKFGDGTILNNEVSPTSLENCNGQTSNIQSLRKVANEVVKLISEDEKRTLIAGLEYSHQSGMTSVPTGDSVTVPSFWENSLHVDQNQCMTHVYENQMNQFPPFTYHLSSDSMDSHLDEFHHLQQQNNISEACYPTSDFMNKSTTPLERMQRYPGFILSGNYYESGATPERCFAEPEPVIDFMTDLIETAHHCESVCDQRGTVSENMDNYISSEYSGNQTSDVTEKASSKYASHVLKVMLGISATDAVACKEEVPMIPNSQDNVEALPLQKSTVELKSILGIGQPLSPPAKSHVKSQDYASESQSKAIEKEQLDRVLESRENVTQPEKVEQIKHSKTNAKDSKPKLADEKKGWHYWKGKKQRVVTTGDDHSLDLPSPSVNDLRFPSENDFKSASKKKKSKRYKKPKDNGMNSEQNTSQESTDTTSTTTSVKDTNPTQKVPNRNSKAKGSENVEKFSPSCGYSWADCIPSCDEDLDKTLKRDSSRNSRKADCTSNSCTNDMRNVAKEKFPQTTKSSVANEWKSKVSKADPQSESKEKKNDKSTKNVSNRCNGDGLPTEKQHQYYKNYYNSRCWKEEEEEVYDMQREPLKSERWYESRYQDDRRSYKNCKKGQYAQSQQMDACKPTDNNNKSFNVAKGENIRYQQNDGEKLSSNGKITNLTNSSPKMNSEIPKIPVESKKQAKLTTGSQSPGQPKIQQTFKSSKTNKTLKETPTFTSISKPKTHSNNIGTVSGTTHSKLDKKDKPNGALNELVATKKTKGSHAVTGAFEAKGSSSSNNSEFPAEIVKQNAKNMKKEKNISIKEQIANETKTLPLRDKVRNENSSHSGRYAGNRKTCDVKYGMTDDFSSYEQQFRKSHHSEVDTRKMGIILRSFRTSSDTIDYENENRNLEKSVTVTRKLVQVREFPPGNFCVIKSDVPLDSLSRDSEITCIAEVDGDTSSNISEDTNKTHVETGEKYYEERFTDKRQMATKVLVSLLEAKHWGSKSLCPLMTQEGNVSETTGLDIGVQNEDVSLMHSTLREDTFHEDLTSHSTMISKLEKGCFTDFGIMNHNSRKKIQGSSNALMCYRSLRSTTMGSPLKLMPFLLRRYITLEPCLQYLTRYDSNFVHPINDTSSLVIRPNVFLPVNHRIEQASLEYTKEEFPQRQDASLQKSSQNAKMALVVLSLFFKDICDKALPCVNSGKELFTDEVFQELMNQQFSKLSHTKELWAQHGTELLRLLEQFADSFSKDYDLQKVG